jgi:hypothetical protein
MKMFYKLFFSNIYSKEDLIAIDLKTKNDTFVVLKRLHKLRTNSSIVNKTLISLIFILFIQHLSVI